MTLFRIILLLLSAPVMANEQSSASLVIRGIVKPHFSLQVFAQPNITTTARVGSLKVGYVQVVANFPGRVVVSSNNAIQYRTNCILDQPVTDKQCDIIAEWWDVSPNTHPVNLNLAVEAL